MNQQPAFVQHPDLRDFMKPIITDAILLQTRERTIANTTSLEEELQKLVIMKDSLPPESCRFPILPVANGGRVENLDRYLLIWCSTFKPHYPSLPQEISQSTLDVIYRVTGRHRCGLMMHKVAKGARDPMMACSKKLGGEQSAELTKSPRSEAVLRVIQEAFGGPKAKPHFATSPFPGHTGQNNAKSDTSIEVDTCAGSKEEETTEDGDIEDNGSQSNHDDFQPKAGPKSAVGGLNPSIGDDSGIEALRSMMARLATTRKKKGPAVIVKLARPPPQPSDSVDTSSGDQSYSLSTARTPRRTENAFTFGIYRQC
ncbi:hypothetical protein FRC05_007657 [Tulasnella sp. 425]|nr:hypothetical protein FRC05_007657 [Tulasnella sp. 425]